MGFARVSSLLLLACLLSACASGQEPDTSNDLPVRCVDKPDPGSCGGRLKRFWYDYGTNRCRVFYYGGCGGRVPFETFEACERLCVAK